MTVVGLNSQTSERGLIGVFQRLYCCFCLFFLYHENSESCD